MVSTKNYINYDNLASIYDISREISDDLLNLFYQKCIESTKSLFPINNVLEIGCGTGRISKAFATNNINVMGIDISQNMLDIANDKAKNEGWTFKSIIADARNLPFEDNTFDMFYIVHVLHLIKEWKKVILEGLRVTKSNIFINAYLERPFYSEIYKKKYWEYLREIGFLPQNERHKELGAKNQQEIIDFMKELQYSFKEIYFKITVKIERERIINIITSKIFSSLRTIPDNIHEKAVEFFKNNNYFLPSSDKIIELEERGKIFLFIKD